MADVRPFRAVRYGEAVGHDLGRLIAPPYDVSRPDLVALLHQRSPYNMVHLEHVRPDPGDDPHALAAARYRRWLRDGLLTRDGAPAVYRYDHTFTVDGRRLTRRGIFAVVGLAGWEERIVLPHEGTFPGPVGERLRRLRAVRANLSPIYLLVRDASGDFRALLDASDDGRADVDATDPDGELHRLTTLADPAIARDLGAILAGRRLYVADGHHRYEAALAYRDERRGGTLDAPPAPADEPGTSAYVLALISDADDPSILVLPTHRLVRDLPDLDRSETLQALARLFDLEPLALAGGADADGYVEAAIGEAGTICLALFAGEAGAWRLRAKSDSPHAVLLPEDRSAAWRALPTAILEHVVLGQVLGLTGERRLAHVTHTQEAAVAMAAVERGESQAAFLVRASTVDELIAVADAGERMPPKSTYFSPKVPAGLVIHDLM
jgi:uncharacterized protein (DUF1015 family)